MPSRKPSFCFNFNNAFPLSTGHGKKSMKGCFLYLIVKIGNASQCKIIFKAVSFAARLFAAWRQSMEKATTSPAESHFSSIKKSLHERLFAYSKALLTYGFIFFTQGPVVTSSLIFISKPPKPAQA